jgi:chromosome segregation ATPase
MARFLALTLAAVIGVASPALAQNATIETRLRDQLKQTVVQLRDLQNSQSALEAAKIATEKERDALKAKLANQSKSPPKASADPQQIAELRASNNSLKDRADAERAALSKANAEMIKANELIQQLQAEKAQLQQAAVTDAAPLADAKAAVEACLVKNQKLVVISTEILTAYENISVGKVVRAREPFIQSKRVAIENAAQGFGDEIYKSKFNPAHDRAAQSEPLTTDVPPAQQK